MRKLFLLCSLLLLILSVQAAEQKMVSRFNRTTKKWVSIPQVSIHDIQFCSPESLHVADSLQVATDTPSPRWHVQASAYDAQIVEVTGVIVVAPAADPPNRGIIYTQHGWNLLLHDTSGQNAWAGLFVRVGSSNGSYTGGGAPDTNAMRNLGFTNLARGTVIKIVGTISEFPSLRLNSSTQLAPDTDYAITILDQNRFDLIPAPTKLPISSFYTGVFNGGGKVHYSTGEQYEASLVEFDSVTVNGIINATRGTFNMIDENNNYMSDYDISYYWSIGSSETNPLPGDPNYVTPPNGGVINLISGTMWTASGSDGPRGYRISPLFPGDVQYGVSLPTVNTERRYPILVTQNDTVLVQAKVKLTEGGYMIGSAALFVSVNNGPFISQPMSTISGDTTFQARILDGDNNPYLAGTFIRYYIQGTDTAGNTNIEANPTGSDSTKGFFFYTVSNGQYTIHDVQYTPYTSGSSPYDGASITVRGIVTAGDSDISASPASGGGTSSWYIQNGSGAWNGIWVVKDTLLLPHLDTLQIGDSVSISGKVREVLVGTSQQLRNTQIFDSTFHIYARNKALPAPVTVTAGAMNNIATEEQYEGVLVRLVNLTVVDTGITFSDPTEFLVNDGSVTGVVVRRDGINHYSNVDADTALGKTILHKGEHLDTLIGVDFYSFGSYKIVPRRDNDFVVGTHYSYNKGWNIVSVPKKQVPSTNAYQVSKLFPGFSTGAYDYANGYHIHATVKPGIGYWVKFPQATTVTQIGKIIKNDTIALSPGWNMIGSTGDSIATSSVTVVPSNSHLSVFYGYNHTYQITTTIAPGFGYWVKSDSAGYLIEHDANAFAMPKAPATPPSLNSITFSDENGNKQELYFTEDTKGTIRLADYEMPPAFTNDFDVRFASGRILDVFGGNAKSSAGLPISLNVKGGLTVSWNIVDKSGMSYVLAGEQAEGVTPIDPVEMKSSGTVKNLKYTGGKLYIRLGSATVPKTFYLSQNYPNPFNPTTRMDVGLAAPSHLTVAIYNVLGQKVRTLVDEERGAGVQTMIWNGNTDAGIQVATGLYFVRMNAGSFTQVRKIMMMK